ncbi:hypothetical protein JCM19231_1284 [Vibrio ishigakensis]|uniref:Uncharacterized protein n=1 Tax=Vibrio ishigakensis TaxID=1481914 RepID=A0A0B8NQV8_9VIBR|nr:hypothetical protein JCM19231_1284 [Vibrio ishigakensis]
MQQHLATMPSLSIRWLRLILKQATKDKAVRNYIDVISLLIGNQTFQSVKSGALVFTG